MEELYAEDARRVSAGLLHISLSPQHVIELAKHLPPDSEVLALVETELREQSLWVEPVAA
jgi:hypothetical protein